MVKILGNRLQPHNNVVKFEIYVPDDDNGYDLGIIGETRKFGFVRSCTLKCDVVSEQQIKNLGLINTELLKIDINKDGSVTVMVLI